MKLNEIRQLEESFTVTDRYEIFKLLRYSDSEERADWEYQQSDFNIDDKGVVTVRRDFHIEDDLVKNGKLIIKFAKVDGNLEYTGTRLNSFENFPRIIEGDLTFYSSSFTDLRGISDHIDYIHGTLEMKFDDVTDGGLGLLNIDGLRDLMTNSNLVAYRAAWRDARNAYGILVQYFDKNNPNYRNIFECQNELIEAGLDRYAEV